MAKKPDTFGTKLRKLRLARNWSQKQAADFIGCEQATISRLENDQWEPSGLVRRMVEVLEESQSAGKAA